MFTGLIEACVAVRSLERRGAGARLTLPEPFPSWRVAHGESVAVSGCCLTVVGGASAAGGVPAPLEFDLSAETLARTWFGELAPGRLVNLERAMRLDDRLGGHLVSGHVDGVGAITRIDDSGDGGWRMGFEVPAGFERYLIDKGSVTIDGISLTVVEPRGRSFDVALIPETLAKTHLGRAEVGQRVNLEADLVGKWIERLVAPHTAR
ncbi:MAG: riboflavin synthase [Planctomycetes bacterium]|nr:riboflavin synthase [Planctomycetota bacterium]